MSVGPLPLADLLALACFSLCCGGYVVLAGQRRASRRSLLQATYRHRRVWMERMLERDNRIFDSNLLGNLMRSVSFFASTTIIVIGGVFAMFGSADRAVAATADLPFIAHASRELWQIKLVVLGVLFVYAFFKFTWSLRQFNYCSIMMGAAPMPGDFPDRASLERCAEGLARLNSLAGDQFNQGLRAYYFGLAVMSWLIHPLLFAPVSVLTVAVLYRREFNSTTLDALAYQYEAES
ncbi:DUF599 domain-containing protein [Plasticicumulans sp.]|uniref:DUF599 domain-containing protein n=2 Tax=Plasticicumulans sp. TaxID=2307179 RepID=UPI00322044A2